MLFGTQTTLIATRRPRLHQRLGVAGAVLAAVMLVVGYTTAIRAAQTGFAPVPGIDALAFLLTGLSDLTAFSVFICAALYWHRRADVHKRLMWLATAALLFAVVTRIPHARGKLPLILIVWGGILLIAPVYERLVGGRVHRVSLYGGLTLFLSVPARAAVGHTVWWHHVAAWLTR